MFTSSGSAAFTLTQAVASPNDCIVHIDGIYQTPTDAYTVSGTTLTFTATPASGRKVVVYSVKAGVSGNNLNVQTINGNGSDHTFTLNVNPINENNTIVHIDGIYQTPTDAYTVSGTTLTFTATPASGRKVVVYSVKAGVSGNNLNIQTINGNGTDHTFTLNVNPINENNTIIHIDGVYQQKSSYTVSGTSLSFGSGNIPANGTVIEVATFTQTEINVPVNDTIDTVHIKDDAVTSAKLGGNLVAPGTVTASAGFVGPLTGNVTGTIQTAAQTNITSVGTLSNLTTSGFAKADNYQFYQNSSATGATDAIYRKTTATLAFKTGSTERMTLDGSGNLAVTGTIATGGITINGAGSTISDSSDFGIVSGGTLTMDVTGDIILDADDSGHIRFKDGGTQYASIYKSGSGAIIDTPSGGDLTLDVAGDIILDSGNNRVGIGTSAPAEALQVAGGIKTTGGFLANTANSVGISYSSGFGHFISWGADGSTKGAYKFTGSASDGSPTADYMVIDTSGNVGIGVTSPTSYYSQFDNLVVGASGANGITVVSGTSHSGTLAFADGTSGNAAYRGFVQYDHNTDALLLGTSGATAITFDSSGNVGIGANPGCKLEVVNSGEARIKARSTNNNWAGLDLESHSTQSNYIFFRDNSAERARIQVTDGNDIVISNTSSVTPRMRINNSGYVGIGTGIGANPLTMLDVESTAADWISRFKNYDSGAYGVSIDLSGSSASDVYAFATYTPAGSGFFVNKRGRVGIGITNPLSPLSVQADTGAGAVRFIGRSADSISSVGFYNSAQDSDIYLQSNGSWFRSRADSGFHFAKGNTPNTSAAPTDSFTIEGMRVGIGTVNPNNHSQLHIANGPYAFLTLDSTNTGGRQYELFSYASDESFHIYDRTASAYRFTLNELGKVGIGTTNPTRKLHVVSTGSATYSGTGAGSNIALHLANLESGAAGRTIGIGMSSESNAEVYLNCVTESGNNGGDFVIASRLVSTRAEKMRVHAAGSVTKPLNPSFNARYPAVTAGGNATIVFSSTHHNIGSHYNTSTGVFTAPVAGSYLFSFAILMDPSGTNHYARVLFSKNGTSATTTYGDSLESADYDQTQDYQSLSMTAVIYMSANDTMRLQNTGQSPTYGTSYGSFSGYLLG